MMTVLIGCHHLTPDHSPSGATAAKMGIIRPVTMHTQHHSFATHLLKAGTDLHVIQGPLVHNHLKINEIYDPINHKGTSYIKSPLDDMDVF